MVKERTKKAGNILSITATITLSILLLLQALSKIFNMTLIYNNIYTILRILFILSFIPAIIIKTRDSKKIFKVIGMTVVVATLTMVWLVFMVIVGIGGQISLSPRYDIVYSMEGEKRVVELSRDFTFFMDEHMGGREYKKAYVKCFIFYDNDLIIDEPGV